MTRLDTTATDVDDSTESEPIDPPQQTDGTVDGAADESAASEHDSATDTVAESTADNSRRRRPAAVIGFLVLPVIAMVLAGGAGYLKYLDSTARGAQSAEVGSVQAAKDSTVAMLSYTPDTADKVLTAATDRMTGTFRDSYGQLIHDVVIPGAKEQKVAAVASVPAAASISVDSSHAVVLVYVNQAITTADTAPTQTNSVVQVTLDRIGDRWLISGFDPK